MWKKDGIIKKEKRGDVKHMRFLAYHDIKVKREVLKLAQLMLGLFCCSKTISYQ